MNKEYFQTTNSITGRAVVNLRPFYNRYFFKSLFGSETSESTYYSYSPSFTNELISLRVDETSDSTNYLTTEYDECYVDSIELTMETNEFVKMSVDWTAFDYESIASYALSPPYDYVEEEPMPFYKVDIEMATGVASLTDAYLKNATINYTRISNSEYYVNDIMPQERYNNGAINITGSLEFNSADYDKFAYQIESDSMVDVELKMSLYDVNGTKKIEIYFPTVNFIKTSRRIEKHSGTKSVSFNANPTDSYIRIYKTE